MHLSGLTHLLCRLITAFSASQCTASLRSVSSASQALHVEFGIKSGAIILCPLSSSQVRKAAQQGVCAILRGSDFLFTDNAPSHHPAAVTTAKFCIKEMEQAGGKMAYFYS